MRRHGILLLSFLPFFLLASPKESQDYLRAKSYLKTNSYIVEKIDRTSYNPGVEIVELETPFAQSVFSSPGRSKVLNGRIIEKIQLIYTTYALSPSFDQQKLNLQRLDHLYDLLPEAFSSPYTQWELVGQSTANSPESGKTYYHGFLIFYRPASTPESMKEELKYIDDLFLPTLVTGSSSSDSSHAAPDKLLIMSDGSTTILRRNIPDDSLWIYIRPSSATFRVIDAKWGDKEHTSVIVTEITESGYKRKRNWKLEDHFEEPSRGGSIKLDPNNPDSVVMAAFRRNKWKNAIIITDVTGSMSPYTAQTLAIIPALIAGRNISGSIFFNDGDGKKTNNKPLGNAGGIYASPTTSIDSIYYFARKAMQNGDGGDIPENDLEACIYAINKMNPQGDIVLIADNYASPRDLELADRIGRPVHIVLCGARVAINPDYLFLARQTGGSIHTLTQDITGLDQMQDGDVILIGRQHFLLHGEHFICTDTFNDPR